MIKFLTSNLMHYHKSNGEIVVNEIDNSNGLVNQLKQYLKDNKCVLFIASDSADIDATDKHSKLLFDALSLSGINFENYYMLDQRNKDKTVEYISQANLIILNGGSTYLQNNFFKEINLKENIENYDGVVLGISAGSLNMSTEVFNSPEELDNSEPINFDGLGLTDINIEPHFVLEMSPDPTQEEIYQRKYIEKESITRDLIGLVDGSHILINDEGNYLYGESYLIRDGNISKICNNGEGVTF